MRFFIAGVMQGSSDGSRIADQGYRQSIAQALLARWPDTEVVDPFSLHPNSLEYDDAAARETLFAMIQLAVNSDLVIAYVPEASMGTALEMYAAYQAGVPVVTISPMTHNWVVRSLSRRVFADLEGFIAFVENVDSPDGARFEFLHRLV
jgi:hypothetical protein